MYYLLVMSLIFVMFSLNVLIFILVFFCSFLTQMHAFASVLSLSVLALHPANLMTLTRSLHALWLPFDVLLVNVA